MTLSKRLLLPFGLAMGLALSPRTASAETSASPPAAPEPQRRPALVHEPYLTSGFTYYGSDRRVIAGLGGGLGYRLDLGSHFAVHVEGRWLTYIGNSFTGALGATYRIRYRSWEPSAGIQLAGYTGGDIQVIASATPTIPPALAFAVQGRLAFLRFTDDQFAVSALALDLGYGSDAGSRATAVTLTFLELAIRL